MAHNQIAYGDVIVLNKTDLVEESELKKLEERIHSIKTYARILRSTNSQVPLELLLDTALFESEAFAQEDKHHDHEHKHDDHSHDRHHHHEHDHHEHTHDHHDHDHSHHLEEDGFNSVAFESDRPLNLDRFQTFLNNLPDEVFRAKGMLWFSEYSDRHIFHLCGRRYTLNGEDWPEDVTPKNQLVLIGQHLKTRLLLKQLNGCVEEPEATTKNFARNN